MKKIKVVFEVDAETVKTLIQSGAKGKKTITDKEVAELSKKGLINAADYLSASEQVKAVGAVSKVVGKVVSKASNKTVQRVAITEVSNMAIEMFAVATPPKKPTGPRK